MSTWRKSDIRISEMLDVLTPREKKIADYILANPEETLNITMETLAKRSGTSVSSVVRLCKSLGCTGYKELCRRLTGDLAASENAITYQEIHPGSRPFEVFRNICLSNMKAIENTLRMTEQAPFEKAVSILCRAGRIDFYGVGNSGLVALDAQSKFVRIGKTVSASADIHIQHLIATSLKAGDAAVFISYSGETNDILSLAKEASGTGCDIITLTGRNRNSLCRYGSVHLYVSSIETYIRSGAMSSRIAQMTMIDALYGAVCTEMYDTVKPSLDMTQHVAEKARSK